MINTFCMAERASQFQRDFVSIMGNEQISNKDKLAQIKKGIISYKCPAEPPKADGEVALKYAKILREYDANPTLQMGMLKRLMKYPDEYDEYLCGLGTIIYDNEKTDDEKIERITEMLITGK